MAVTAEPAAEPAPEQADMKEPAAEARHAFASTSAPQSSLKGKVPSPFARESGERVIPSERIVPVNEDLDTSNRSSVPNGHHRYLASRLLQKVFLTERLSVNAVARWRRRQTAPTTHSPQPAARHRCRIPICRFLATRLSSKMANSGALPSKSMNLSAEVSVILACASTDPAMCVPSSDVEACKLRESSPEHLMPNCAS